MCCARNRDFLEEMDVALRDDGRVAKAIRAWRPLGCERPMRHDRFAVCGVSLSRCGRRVDGSLPAFTGPKGMCLSARSRGAGVGLILGGVRRPPAGLTLRYGRSGMDICPTRDTPGVVDAGNVRAMRRLHLNCWAGRSESTDRRLAGRQDEVAPVHPGRRTQAHPRLLQRTIARGYCRPGPKVGGSQGPVAETGPGSD